MGNRLEARVDKPDRFLPKPKGEALTHISAGQRPAYGTCRRTKAASLAHSAQYVTFYMRKAYSLECVSPALRRALPCANIHKAFSLNGVRTSLSAWRGSSLCGQECPHSVSCRAFSLFIKRGNILRKTVGSLGSDDTFTSSSLTAYGEDSPLSKGGGRGADGGLQETFFTGKPHVAGLGHAFLLRNYRSDLSKWQTADPLGYPDGLNNFAYCNGRVTDCVDWLGASIIKTTVECPSGIKFTWEGNYKINIVFLANVQGTFNGSFNAPKITPNLAAITDQLSYKSDTTPTQIITLIQQVVTYDENGNEYKDERKLICESVSISATCGNPTPVGPTKWVWADPYHTKKDVFQEFTLNFVLTISYTLLQGGGGGSYQMTIPIPGTLKTQINE